jgi:DnaK suppressor protein
MATKKKPAAKKAAKKAASKKVASKKTASKKTAGKKTVSKKKVAKTAAAKPAAKKVSKKPAVKKAAAKKAVTKNATPTNPASKPRTVSSLPDVPDIDPTLEVKPLYGEAYKIKRGEEYMSPPMVQHFRQILLAWKTELMEEVDRTMHHMRDEAANFPDPNDRATQETEFTLELRARDRERKLIKKIDESMEALKHDDYGYCDICGVEIGVRRLEARPTATQCIDCKTLDEIREKQLG